MQSWCRQEDASDGPTWREVKPGLDGQVPVWEWSGTWMDEEEGEKRCVIREYVCIYAERYIERIYEERWR